MTQVIFSSFEFYLPAPFGCIYHSSGVLYHTCPQMLMDCSILLYLHTFCTDVPKISSLILKPPRENCTVNIKGCLEQLVGQEPR